MARQPTWTLSIRRHKAEEVLLDTTIFLSQTCRSWRPEVCLFDHESLQVVAYWGMGLRRQSKYICGMVLRVKTAKAFLQIHFALRTTHCTLHTPHFTLHTALFALQTSLHPALLRLHTWHFTLQTSQSTLHTSLFKLHSSRPTLLIALLTLHTPHFISSELFSP